MVTRINLPDVSLMTFKEAARQGGRIRVKDGGDGRPELIYGERRTLFGRAVGWIRDAFKSTARLEREGGEEAAAARVFFELIEMGFSNVARAAATASAVDDLKSGVPLRKLVERSIKIAERTETTRERGPRAEALRKAGSFLPRSENFARASERAGVDSGAFTTEQLELADALIRFEASERTDKVSKGEMARIAEAAALAASKLGEVAGSFWFDGTTTLDEAVARLVRQDPDAAALLGMVGLPQVRAAVEGALPLLKERDIAMEDTPKAGDYVTARAVERDVSGQVDALSDDVKHTIVVPLDGPVTKSGVKVAQGFVSDRNRTDLLLPIDVTRTVSEDAEAAVREAVLREISALADQSPAIGRAIEGLRDADEDVDDALEETLESFLGALASLEDGELVEETLPAVAPAGSGVGKRPDSPLTLTAARAEGGGITINARMTAQLGASASLEEAARELLLVADGDAEVASQLTRVAQQGLFNGLMTATLGRSQTGTYAMSGVITVTGGTLTQQVDLSRTDDGGFAFDAQYRQEVPPGTRGRALNTFGPVPLDPAARHVSGFTAQVVVSRDSLERGEPDLELGRPIAYEARMTADPDVLRDARAVMEEALPDAEEPLDSEPGPGRLWYRNYQLLGRAYAPGGARADEAWQRAGADAAAFRGPRAEAVSLLARNAVFVDGLEAELTPQEVRDRTARAVGDVSGLSAREALALVDAERGFGTAVIEKVDAIGWGRAEEPREFLRALAALSKAAEQRIAADPLEEDDIVGDQAILRPAVYSAVGTMTRAEARRFLDRLQESPTIGAFLATTHEVAEEDRFDEAQVAMVERWRNDFLLVVNEALRRLDDSMTLDAFVARIMAKAPGEADGAMTDALYTFSADVLVLAAPVERAAAGEDVSESEEEDAVGFEPGGGEDKSVTASRRFMAAVAARHGDEEWEPQYPGDKGKGKVPT